MRVEASVGGSALRALGQAVGQAGAERVRAGQCGAELRELDLEQFGRPEALEFASAPL